MRRHPTLCTLEVSSLNRPGWQLAENKNCGGRTWEHGTSTRQQPLISGEGGRETLDLASMGRQLCDLLEGSLLAALYCLPLCLSRIAPLAEVGGSSLTSSLLPKDLDYDENGTAKPLNSAVLPAAGLEQQAE